MVTNTGNVTLTTWRSPTTWPGLSAINCGAGTNVVASFAPGASVTCTATYTTTQADVDAGSITNTGTATGTPPSGPPITDTSLGQRSRPSQSPAITHREVRQRAELLGPGHRDHLHLPGHQHRQRHAQPGHRHRPDDGAVGDQLPGHLARRRGQRDLHGDLHHHRRPTSTAGPITNTGTATGTPPSGPNVTDTSSVTIPAPDPGHHDRQVRQRSPASRHRARRSPTPTWSPTPATSRSTRSPSPTR